MHRQLTQKRDLRRLSRQLDRADRAQSLKAQATHIRRSVVEMIGRAGLGHIGGDFSVSDILTTLFFSVLRVDPTAPMRRCATGSS